MIVSQSQITGVDLFRKFVEFEVRAKSQQISLGLSTTVQPASLHEHSRTKYMYATGGHNSMVKTLNLTSHFSDAGAKGGTTSKPFFNMSNQFSKLNPMNKFKLSVKGTEQQT